MANSTTNLDLISSSQATKEVTANALFDADSPVTVFGRRASTTTALTWGYYGGTITVDGVLTQIVNGTLALTASATNYVEADRTGALYTNVTAFTPGRTPLYRVVTGTATVSSYTDYRAWVQPRHLTSQTSVALAAANVVLTQAQAFARYLILTGTLTANVSVIVPLYWEGIVFNNTTGAFAVTIIPATGTGVIVAQTKRALLLSDGTNVQRITADA